MLSCIAVSVFKDSSVIKLANTLVLSKTFKTTSYHLLSFDTTCEVYNIMAKKLQVFENTDVRVNNAKNDTLKIS